MMPLLLALALACSPPTSPQAPPAPETQDAATSRPPSPPPATVDGSGLAERLTAPADRVRVFNFWASWCPPCLAELPMLRTFQFRNPDVEVVLVNVDHVTVQGAKVPILVRNHGLESLTHLLLQSNDPNRTLREQVADWPEQLPTTLVVGRDGTRRALFREAITPDALTAAVRDARDAPAPR